MTWGQWKEVQVLVPGFRDKEIEIERENQAQVLTAWLVISMVRQEALRKAYYFWRSLK